jgi:hypothetical protein
MIDNGEDFETFIFFRDGMFYPVEIPPSQVQANVDLNPGTLMVVHAEDGNIVWSPPLKERAAAE